MVCMRVCSVHIRLYLHGCIYVYIDLCTRCIEVFLVAFLNVEGHINCCSLGSSTVFVRGLHTMYEEVERDCAPVGPIGIFDKHFVH